MGKYNNAVITNAGHILFAKALANEAPIEWTKFVTSTYEYPETTDFENMSEILDIAQTGTVNRYLRVNEKQTQAELLLLNTGVQQTYYINTFALYANDPEVGEVIVAVCTAAVEGGKSLADPIPADDGISVAKWEHNIIFTFSNDVNPTVWVNPAGIVTNEQLIRLLKYNSGTKQISYSTPTGQGSATVNYEKRFNRCFIHCDELDYIASTTQSGSFRSFTGLPYPAKFNQSFLVAKDTVIGIPLWINLTAGSTDFNVSSMAIYYVEDNVFGVPFPSQYSTIGNGGTMKFSFEYVTDDAPDEGYYDNIDELNQKLENALNGGI